MRNLGLSKDDLFILLTPNSKENYNVYLKYKNNYLEYFKGN